jgi:hypothetical protein
MEHPDKPSNEIFYDEVALIMQKNRHKWAKLTGWVATAMKDIADGVAMESPNPYKQYWYRLKYGTHLGLYDVHSTNKAISALVAAAAHYSVFHFDNSNTEECDFYSFAGAGRIIIHDSHYLVLVAVGISLSTVILFQLVWW